MTFHLQIVTPDRKIFDGEAEKIIVRTVNGDVCILARHIDYAAPLGIGEARVTDAEGNTRTAACSGGMIGVSAGEVRVMATTFEWSDKIDVARAEAAYEKAQQRLRKENASKVDIQLAEAKLHRALIRKSVASNK